MIREMVSLRYFRKSVLPYALLHFANTLLFFQKFELARDVRIPNRYQTVFKGLSI